MIEHCYADDDDDDNEPVKGKPLIEDDDDATDSLDAVAEAEDEEEENTEVGSHALNPTACMPSVARNSTHDACDRTHDACDRRLLAHSGMRPRDSLCAAADEEERETGLAASGHKKHEIEGVSVTLIPSPHVYPCCTPGVRLLSDCEDFICW